MVDFVKKYWLLLLTEILVLTIFCLFYGRFGSIDVDSFREVYIPEQILNGKALYKDIFCIYPPLGYLINAFLFKVCGIHLSVIYFVNLTTVMCIFFFLYKISRYFLNNFVILGINLFILAGFILSPNVFNAFLPYSSGMLYGLLFSLLAIYCALSKKLPLAYLFCSLAICSKTEFLFLLPALLFFSKKELLLKNILYFLAPIFTICGILYLQGVHFSDYVTALNLIQLMGQTSTLKFFYFSLGLIPNFAHIPLYLSNFLKFILPFSWNNYQEILCWIFPLISFLFLVKYKLLTLRERFIIYTSILISIKVFFALILQSYGVYFLPFALLSFAILLRGNFRKVFSVLLVIWSLIAGTQHVINLSMRDYTISTSSGMIKLDKNLGINFHELLEYVESLPAESKILLYPEGLGFNFLSGKKSDDKFYSLIPLYVESFGEEIIINRIKHVTPDYIVISNYNSQEYGYKHFGSDYAIAVFEYINMNYTKVKSIGNDSYTIYCKK